MRPAAGLHRGDLLRLSQRADIEDADAAETLRAGGRGHAAGATVDASEPLLDAHEEQVAVDGDVALPAGAHHRRLEARPLRVLDVVDVDPVIVADPEIVLAERQVGVRKAHEQRPLFRRRSVQARHRRLIGILRRG
jgi:hypothetical protein